MREQLVKAVVDKGFRAANSVSSRTRTRLSAAAASSASSSASPKSLAQPDSPSVCPHHHHHHHHHTHHHHTHHPQSLVIPPSSSAPHSRCVFSQRQVVGGGGGSGGVVSDDVPVRTAAISTSVTTSPTPAVAPSESQTSFFSSSSPSVRAEGEEEQQGLAIQQQQDVRSFESMPGPKGYPVVGTLLEYFRKENRGRMHEIQRRNHQQYGTIFKEPFGPAQNVCVADPSIVEEILRSEGQFPNRPPYESWVLYNRLRNRRGGVMTSQGDYWKRSRRTLNPKLLKPQAAGEYMQAMGEATEEFVQRVRHLKAAQKDCSVRQLPLEINKYTMEAIGRVLLNVRIGTLDPNMSPKVREFIKAIGVMFLTGHQLMAFAKVHQILRTRVWRLHVQAWDTIYTISNELIADKVDAAKRRLEEESPPSLEEESGTDLITHMVDAGTLTREEIIDNLTETFMGGVDTVANGVSFMLYLLSINQSAQSKLREEVDNVVGKRSCTMSDLQVMPYLKAVVKETLRLYPPIPLNARVTQDEIVLNNYRIPKGTIIMLNNYTMSRDERIFRDPDSFVPDRWLKAEVSSWHPFSAIPFGYGVRSCVGRRLSENLMYAAAIQMVQNFVLKKDPSYDITPRVRTQFTPGPELPVLFEER